MPDGRCGRPGRGGRAVLRSVLALLGASMDAGLSLGDGTAEAFGTDAGGQNWQ